MKYITVSVVPVVAVALSIWTAGCDDDHHDMMSDGTSNSMIARVYPAEGAANIAVSSSIAVKFTGPMDTSSVMNNLHLTGGDDMYTWMDSANQYGGFGHMSIQHMNHMMDWMHTIHISGSFHWNLTLDSCEFIPDSHMTAYVAHMILMNEGGMMNHGGGMMGTDHGDEGFHTYHFTTGP